MKNNELHITFPSLISPTIITDLLSDYYTISLKSNEVLFNLNHLEGMDLFSISLFLSWIITISSRDNNKKKVTIILPEGSKISNRLRKEFFDLGFIRYIEQNSSNISIKRNGSPTQYAPDGIPLVSFDSTIDSIGNIWKTFEGIISSSISIEQERIVEECQKCIISELSENAINHGEKRFPHFSISFHVSSGSTYTTFFSPYEAGTVYVDMLIGDLGEGIVKKIKKYTPEKYIPTYKTNFNINEYERILLYSFEFASTSNIDARIDRIKRIIDNDNFPISSIGTGLHTVLNTARKYMGQFAVCVPECGLLFDFSDTNLLRIERLSKSKILTPGTHFLLRIPLKTHNANVSITRKQENQIRNYNEISFISFSNIYKTDQNISSAMQKVFSEILNRENNKNAIVITVFHSFESLRTMHVFLLGIFLQGSSAQIFILWPEIFNSLKDDYEMIQRLKELSLCHFPILIGNGVSKQLINVFDDSLETELTEELYQDICYKNSAQIKEELSELLESTEVKHANGPFFFEEGYFTKLFYEVRKATEYKAFETLFSLWFCNNIEDNCDYVLVTRDYLLRSIELAKTYLNSNKKEIEVILFQYPSEQPSSLAPTLKLINKKGIIVTDVICRANTMRELLSTLSHLSITYLFTVIDARQERNPIGGLTYTIGEKDKIINLKSLIYSPIIRYDDISNIIKKNRRDIGIEEYVPINRTLNSPTVLLRRRIIEREESFLHDNDLINTRSFFLGHCLLEKKHYIYYINFDILLKYVVQPLKNWIIEQCHFYFKGKEDKYDFFFFDPQNTFRILCVELQIDPKVNSIVNIGKEEVNVLPIEKDEKSNINAIIFIPASDSGDKARKAIEYVSRLSPKRMLLLSFFSRMEPEHLTFMSKINEYSGIPFRFGAFTQLQIPSFGSIKENCPVCTEINLLHRLQTLASNSIGKESNILNALYNKEKLLKPIDMADTLAIQVIENEFSEKTINLAKIRELYNLSKYDIEYKRQLHNSLTEEGIDLFLEVISMERFSNDPYILNIKEHIQKNTFQRIILRVYSIIADSKPPFAINRVIGSLIILAPEKFLNYSYSLLLRFYSSRIDFESILIGCLYQNALPLGTIDLHYELRNLGCNDLDVMLLETEQIIRDNQEKKHSNINILIRIWEQLVESSVFALNLESMLAIDIEAGSIYDNATKVTTGWNNDISPLISELYSSSYWKDFSRYEPAIYKQISYLDGIMARYIAVEQMTVKQNDLLLKYAGNLNTVRSSLANNISMLNVNICGLINKAFSEEKYNTEDRCTILLAKSLDYQIDNVVCNEEQFRVVLLEILKNWREHNNNHDVESTIKTYALNDKVYLIFEDNIPEAIDESSEKGIKVIKSFSKAYNIDFDVEYDKSVNKKSICLGFVAVKQYGGK